MLFESEYPNSIGKRSEFEYPDIKLIRIWWYYVRLHTYAYKKGEKSPKEIIYKDITKTIECTFKEGALKKKDNNRQEDDAMTHCEAIIQIFHNCTWMSWVEEVWLYWMNYELRTQLGLFIHELTLTLTLTLTLILTNTRISLLVGSIAKMLLLQKNTHHR